jgi:SPP1 gp7 family putative phage head morphogenesis protein
MPTLRELAIPRRARRSGLRQPDAQRVAFFRELRPLLRAMRALAESQLLPLIALAYPDELRPEDFRADADDRSFRAAASRVARQVLEEFGPARMRALATAVAGSVDRFQRAQLQQQLAREIAVSPVASSPALQAAERRFVVGAVDRIRTLPARYFGGIAEAVTEAARGGARASELAEVLGERYGVLESDAARIANTAIGQYYGELNRVRQEELGVTRFIWQAALDNRTREAHAEWSGQTFSWDDLPEDPGLNGERVAPGQAPNCRCVALPVLD